MRILLANMDFRNSMVDILAKANDGIYFLCPPAKAGGNSGGNE